MHKIATVYPWATIGGVERVIINRAEAFKQAGLKIKSYAYFYSDAGGINHMRSYIDTHKLKDYLTITLEKPSAEIYFCIDEPDFVKQFSQIHKIQLECHTHYSENRKYLKEIFNLTNTIATPSESFRKELTIECGEKYKEIFLLRNLVPWDIHKVEKTIRLPLFGKLKPALWLGRSDDLKNTKRLIKTVSDYRKKFADEYILLLIGPVIENYELRQYIKLHRMEDRAIILPPIPFEQIPSLIEVVREQGGIFLSASKGETFGLSAAEAIAGGLPVLLSDIPAHAWLVENNANHLFTDDDDFCNKLHKLTGEHTPAIAKMLNLRNNFGINAFIHDFNTRNYFQ